MQSRTLYLLFAASFLVAWVSAQTDAKALVDLTNAYRADNNLPAIPMSYSLTKVALLHTLDMNANGAIQGTCNMHSWSNKGYSSWTGCCYTSDHAQAECMWNKPREITNGTFLGNGYENSAGGGGGLTPAQALDLWKGSPGHNNVILNLDIWVDIQWKSLGAAICGQYAVLWFSDSADPDTRDPSTLTCQSFALPSAIVTPTTSASGPSGTKANSAQAMGSAFNYTVLGLVLSLLWS